VIIKGLHKISKQKRAVFQTCDMQLARLKIISVLNLDHFHLCSLYSFKLIFYNCGGKWLSSTSLPIHYLHHSTTVDLMLHNFVAHTDLLKKKWTHFMYDLSQYFKLLNVFTHHRLTFLLTASFAFN